jgi:hypothetical protein
MQRFCEKHALQDQNGSEEKTYTKHVVHERPPSRANLDQLHSPLWSALAEPFCHKPDANKFAENLRNFRRRDKVTLQAELVPIFLNRTSVISTDVRRQAHAHEARQGNGSGDLEGSDQSRKCPMGSEGLTEMASASCFARGVDHGFSWCSLCALEARLLAHGSRGRLRPTARTALWRTMDCIVEGEEGDGPQPSSVRSVESMMVSLYGGR